MRLFDEFKTQINVLYESLGDYIEKEEFLNRIRYMSDEFDKEIDGITEHLRQNRYLKSNFLRIFKVYERLILVRNLKEQLNGETDWIQRQTYPGLMTYLLLTCFDQLGQDDKGWRFFPDWLNSTKCRLEREEILSVAMSEMPIQDLEGKANLKFIELIFNRYNEIYGVKKSFMKFLRNILPKDQREKLFQRIEIEVYLYSKQEDKSYPERKEGEKEKEGWLFKTRNDFTHNLFTPESAISRGYFFLAGNWMIRDRIYMEEEYKRILVHETLNEEIERSVLIGIVETIKNSSQSK